jgi:CRP-like cAMP-binding protein
VTALLNAVPAAGVVFSRLSRIAPLNMSDLALLADAERTPRRFPSRREIMHEGDPIREPRALLSGWACHQRILSDGRRQILHFLLPGDLLGLCSHDRPLAATTILAMQEVLTCSLPAAAPATPLAEAYHRSAALEEHYLFAQITRLGRLNAYERLADWLLETTDRLALVGLSSGDRFALPLTQELLGDALGLTSVHLNRTLQAMRRDGLLDLRAGTVTLPDRARLEKIVDYKPPRISADS